MKTVVKFLSGKSGKKYKMITKFSFIWDRKYINIKQNILEDEAKYVAQSEVTIPVSDIKKFMEDNDLL